MEKVQQKERVAREVDADERYKGTSIYFETDVLAALDAAAMREERSRSQIVNRALRKALRVGRGA